MTATHDRHPIEALVWEIRRLFHEAAAAANEALEPLGISAGDRALIEFLARESEPITLAELARKRSVSRQHIHQSLARLREPGWVEKMPDPEDARSVRLRLSPSGRSLWHEIRAVDRRLLRRIARYVEASRVQDATQTLHRIREILKAGRSY